MKHLVWICLLMVGCAAITHRSYDIQSGRVVESNKHRVVTVWPRSEYHWIGQDGKELAVGDEVYNVCESSRPVIGTQFTKAYLEWDKINNCWIWSSR